MGFFVENLNGFHFDDWIGDSDARGDSFKEMLHAIVLNHLSLGRTLAEDGASAQSQWASIFDIHHNFGVIIDDILARVGVMHLVDRRPASHLIIFQKYNMYEN